MVLHTVHLRCTADLVHPVWHRCIGVIAHACTQASALALECTCQALRSDIRERTATLVAPSRASPSFFSVVLARYPTVTHLDCSGMQGDGFDAFLKKALKGKSAGCLKHPALQKISIPIQHASVPLRYFAEKQTGIRMEPELTPEAKLLIEVMKTGEGEITVRQQLGYGATRILIDIITPGGTTLEVTWRQNNGLTEDLLMEKFEAEFNIEDDDAPYDHLLEWVAQQLADEQKRQQHNFNRSPFDFMLEGIRDWPGYDGEPARVSMTHIGDDFAVDDSGRPFFRFDDDRSFFLRSSLEFFPDE